MRETDLADRQAITDLIYRYCRAIDRNDIELGAAIWHEDGLADYEGLFSGTGRGLIEFLVQSHHQSATPQHSAVYAHQTSNIILELDGDRANSETYVCSIARFVRDGQTRQATTWGRYIDQWSRRKGRWGIDKRLFILDCNEIRDVAAMSVPERRRPDRGDPSYLVLGRTP
jgi:hypothetical protein